MNFFDKVGRGPRNNRLDFGDDPGHDPPCIRIVMMTMTTAIVRTLS